MTFRDYVLAERQLSETAAAQRSKSYWQQRATELGAPPQLPQAVNPPLDKIRNPTFNHRFGTIEAEDWDQLKQIAQRKGITPASVLAAGLADILASWSTESNFALNTTLFRRFPLHPIVFPCALGELSDSIDWAGMLAYHATETSQVSLDNRIQEYHGT